MNWKKFGQIVTVKLFGVSNDNIDTTAELKSKVGALEKEFEIVFEVWCPAKYSKKK